jgi:hypothetical protein
VKNSVLVHIILFLYRQHVTLSMLAQVALVATDDKGKESVLFSYTECVTLC